MSTCTAQGRLMKPGLRSWPANTEDNISRCAAAHSWLHKYAELHEAGVVVGIGSARMSKLVQPLTIVKNVAENRVFAAMGNRLWAAMGMALASIEVNGETYWKFQKAPLEFLHVYDLSNWVSLAFSETRLQGHGLVLQQCGHSDGMPLLVSTLRAGFHLCLGHLKGLIGFGTSLPMSKCLIGCGNSLPIWSHFLALFFVCRQHCFRS